MVPPPLPRHANLFPCFNYLLDFKNKTNDGDMGADHDLQGAEDLNQGAVCRHTIVDCTIAVRQQLILIITKTDCQVVFTQERDMNNYWTGES